MGSSVAVLILQYLDSRARVLVPGVLVYRSMVLSSKILYKWLEFASNHHDTPSALVQGPILCLSRLPCRQSRESAWVHSAHDRLGGLICSG